MILTRMFLRVYYVDPKFLKVCVCLLLAVTILYHVEFQIVVKEEQLYQVTPGSQTQTVSKETKEFKILFWTTWYGFTTIDENGYSMFGNTSLPCGDFQPKLTWNKSEYSTADVVIFQLDDMKESFKFPSWRQSNVPWILALQETPINQPWKHGSMFDGKFNGTWSLRSDSEIHPKIRDMLDHRQTPDKDWVFGSTFSIEFLRRKTHMAAWVVSNDYFVYSKRNEFARKLHRHGVNITVLNRRNNTSIGLPFSNCPGGESCFKTIGHNYKFYLAFENSLCANFVTEKLAWGIFYGMVPIFYGTYNVSFSAPPNSYIDAMTFNSTEKLAEYLIYLDSHDEAYFKYFEWRQNYSVNLDDPLAYRSAYHCSVWKMMKALKDELPNNATTQKYSNMERWASRLYNSKDGSYCNICLFDHEVDEKNPKETSDRLYRGKNCRKS